MEVKSRSHVRLFATPWTAAHQAPLSVGFSKQEYWSGVPLPSPTKIARRAKKDIETCHNNKSQFTNVSSEQERVRTAGASQKKRRVSLDAQRERLNVSLHGWGIQETTNAGAYGKACTQACRHYGGVM